MKLTTEQIKELQQFDTPTVINALEGFKLRPNTSGFTRPGLLLRTPQTKPMVGYAATAKVSSLIPITDEQKDLMFEYFNDVREMEGPVITVMQDIDEHPIGTFWGEVQATTFMALGAVGTITHGGIRDINEVGPLGFYFFSTDMMVSRADSHLIELKCPVQICGMTVNPGDLIHADVHGATIIPHDVAHLLADACRRVLEAELCVLEPCREAIRKGEMPTIEQLRYWRGEMIRRR